MNLDGKRVLITGGVNRKHPSAVDDQFASLKPALEEAVKDHLAL